VRLREQQALAPRQVPVLQAQARVLLRELRQALELAHQL
jgi:hypothetical protein